MFFFSDDEDMKRLTHTKCSSFLDGRTRLERYVLTMLDEWECGRFENVSVIKFVFRLCGGGSFLCCCFDRTFKIEAFQLIECALVFKCDE